MNKKQFGCKWVNGKVLVSLWGPTTDLDSLEIFENIVSNIIHTTEGTFILGGDFNWPGIDWTSKAYKPKAATPAICEQMINIDQNNSLEQLVAKPKQRENKALDLVFTNNPTLISNVQTVPVISKADQNTGFICRNNKLQVSRQTPIF